MRNMLERVKEQEIKGEGVLQNERRDERYVKETETERWRSMEEEAMEEREECTGVGCPWMGLLLFCSGPISFVLFVCWHQRAASHSPC